jgi:hypothetical protein
VRKYKQELGNITSNVCGRVRKYKPELARMTEVSAIIKDE